MAGQRDVVRDAVGIGIAVGAYGISFGAVATTAGLSVLQACATSLLLFTGASQFALVGVLGAGGSALAGVLSALLLGSRNTLYAVRLADLLRFRGPRRVLAAQLTIDETTAMATATTEHPALAFWATGAAVYGLWNLGTLLGAVGATQLGDPATFGLDAAVPAAFLALLAPRLRERTGLLIAVAGGLLALAAVPLTRPGVPVLVAALAVVPLLVRR
ncbi:MAG: AzlC family protein [Frankiales bacterium]|jgi:predicted branched-subunit amino acid permease|nr:AzlC family protein [Frankiales bacterium]